MFRTLRLISFAGAFVFSAALAQAQIIELEATPEETAAVEAVLAEVGCQVGESPVEKEGADLFEIDDANCTLGQYDIKLQHCPECGALIILSMTYDGRQDADAEAVEATAEEVAQVVAALAAFNCELGEGEVEKETAFMFEIDDAVCQAGQYDIKLDNLFEVISMTRDYD